MFGIPHAHVYSGSLAGNAGAWRTWQTPPRPTGGSMIKAQWHVTLPDLESSTEEEHFAPLLWMLQGMATVNEHIIKWSFRRALQGISPPVPPVYHSGVRYREDPAGKENWRDCLNAMLQRFGDCDVLTSWRTAELRVAGIPAEPAIKWQHIPKSVTTKIRKPDGKQAYPDSMVPDEGLWLVHCSVLHPNGFVEDVSKNLGMGGGYTSSV